MSGSETRTTLATCIHPWWTMQQTSSGLSSSSLSPSLLALLACTMPGKSAQIQKNLQKILTLSCTSGHLAPLSYLLQSLWVLYYLTPAMPSGAIFIFVKSDECGEMWCWSLLWWLVESFDAIGYQLNNTGFSWSTLFNRFICTLFPYFTKKKIIDWLENPSNTTRQIFSFKGGVPPILLSFVGRMIFC